MKQTRADTGIAIAQAIGLHVLLFLLMFAGLQWTRSKVANNAQGEPIEADLVTSADLSAAMQRALKRAPSEPVSAPEPPPEPAPEPLPEPVAEEPPLPKALPPPVPDPAPVEQEKVQRDADTQQVAKQQREQEAKRRQAEQVELEAKRQAELERQRQKQLAEIRKLREQAARERNLAEQRARQQADARSGSAAPATPGNRGADTSLQAKYAAALQQAILRQWIRPETVPLGLRCRIAIRQLPGGEVVDVDVAASCPYDALGRQSVERAVMKASPLPYAGFEAVFNRNLDLNFIPEDR